MKYDLQSARLHLSDHELDFLAGSPVVAHCHHFNLFWDQTMDDALGEEAGRRVRTLAAHKASYRFLRALVDEVGATSPVERLRLAAAVFSAMGHGKLHLAVGRSGGLVRGEQLHYGFGWREKYGAAMRRSAPADAFATGFSAAATEVAYGLDPGSRRGQEERCIVDGSAGCNIRVTSHVGDPMLPLGVDPQSARDVLPPVDTTGLYEDQIAPIVSGLREFLSGVAGDDRGVIEAFGVLVTSNLADYYNHAAADVLEVIAREKPGGVDAFRALLMEAGHACAFHTFGGVLASPEWEGMVGAPSGDPLEIAIGCVSLARALGFGRWSIESFEPGERLVMTSPGTYESLFSRLLAADGKNAVGGIFVGAGIGIMQLAHGVTWQPRPRIDNALYLELAKTSPWRVEQDSSFAAGDPLDRIVVTRR